MLVLKSQHANSVLTFNGEDLNLACATQEQLLELKENPIWDYLFEEEKKEPKNKGGKE